MSNRWTELAAATLGWLRYLAGGGYGHPRRPFIATTVADIARANRYIPGELDDLIARHPDMIEPLIERSQVLAEEQQWEPMLALATRMRERFPDHVAGYQILSGALRRLRRFDEAEAVGWAAIRRFRRAQAGYESVALAAQERGDWEAALRLWTSMAARFDKASPSIFRAGALAHLNRREEADAIFASVVARWPEDWWGQVVYAENAQHLGRWDEAVRRWTVARDRFPGRPEPHAGLAVALLRAGDLDEASHVLAEASFLYPTDQRVLAARAQAEARGVDPGPLPKR